MDINKEETIIIGAHYDHLGYGSFGSLYDGEPAIHNGADDNASGVSILINLANSLKEITDYNYLFIAMVVGTEVMTVISFVISMRFLLITTDFVLGFGQITYDKPNEQPGYSSCMFFAFLTIMIGGNYG